MNNLDDLLGGGEPVRAVEIKKRELNALRITSYAIDKAYAYARIACDVARGTIECGGYLIAPKQSSDRIATDSFLARNQDVSEGLFTINAEDVIKAGREINEMGYKVLGWWHSHGFLKTFFSPTDDNGQITVLNEISAINYITQTQETEVSNLEFQTEGENVVLFDKRSPQRKYKLNIKGDISQASIAGLKLIQEKRIGFAYGLVVNAQQGELGAPYAEIAERELCGFCKTGHDRSVPTDIEIFGGQTPIDEKLLREEVLDRVKMKPKFFGLFSGRPKRHKPPIWGEYPNSGIDSYYMAEFGTPMPESNQPDLFQKPIKPENKKPRKPSKDSTKNKSPDTGAKNDGK